MIPPPHPAYKPPSNGVHSAAGNFLQDRGLSILFLALSIIFALGAFFAYHYGLHNLVTLSFGILSGVSFVCFLGSFFFKKTSPPPVPLPIENPVPVEDTVPGNKEIEKVVSIPPPIIHASLPAISNGIEPPPLIASQEKHKALEKTHSIVEATCDKSFVSKNLEHETSSPPPPPPNSSTKSPALSNTKGILLSGTQEDSQGRIPLQEDEKTTNAHKDSSSEIAKDETNLSKKNNNQGPVVEITIPSYPLRPPTVPFPQPQDALEPLPSYYSRCPNAPLHLPPLSPLPPHQLSDEVPPEQNQVSPKLGPYLGSLIPISIDQLRKETGGFSFPMATLSECSMQSYYSSLVGSLPQHAAKGPSYELKDQLYRHLRCHKNPAILTTIYYQPHEKISLEHLYPASLNQTEIETIDWSVCRFFDLANWKIEPTQFPELLKHLVKCEEFRASTPLSISQITQLLQVPTLSSASIVLTDDLAQLQAWGDCPSRIKHLSCTLPHLDFLEPFLAKISSFDNLESLDIWIESFPNRSSPPGAPYVSFTRKNLLDTIKKLKSQFPLPQTKISLFCNMKSETSCAIEEDNYLLSCVDVSNVTQKDKSNPGLLFAMKNKTSIRFAQQNSYHEDSFVSILNHYRTDSETLAKILRNISKDAVVCCPNELAYIEKLASLFCQTLSEDNLLKLFQKEILFDVNDTHGSANRFAFNLILEYFLRSSYRHAVKTRAHEKARIISNFIWENQITLIHSYIMGLRRMRGYGS